MSRQFMIVALSFACVIATPLCAQTETSAPPALGKADQAAAPEKKVCREETPTGSRISKKVCKPAQEWAQNQRKGEAGANDMLENKGTGTVSGGPGGP